MASLFPERVGLVNSSVYVILSAVFLVGFLTSAVLSSSAGRGREFIFTFPTNLQQTSSADETAHLSLSITAFRHGPTNINITIVDLDWSRVITINNQHEAVTVDLPPEAEARGSAMQNTTLFVTASQDVTVLALSTKEESMGAFLVRSTPNLGVEYFVASYPPSEGEWSEFTISATEDNTLVQLQLKAPLIFDNMPYSRGKLELSLNRLQTAQFQGGLDLTGSQISANRPISVISGSSASNVPVESGLTDHVVEHLPPISTWGHAYAMAPFVGQSSGYTCVVIAGCPMTIIRGFGERVALYTAGASHEWDTQINSPAAITASKPVLVVQFSKGRQGNIDNEADVGDPSMTVIPPVSRFATGGTLVSTPIPPEGAYRYLSVTTRCNETDGIQLNGSPLLPDRKFGFDETGSCIMQKRLGMMESSFGRAIHVEHISPDVQLAVSVAVYGTDVRGAYSVSANLGTESPFCVAAGADECCSTGDMFPSIDDASSNYEASISLDSSSVDTMESGSMSYESPVSLPPNIVASNAQATTGPQDPVILSNIESNATTVESQQNATDSNIILVNQTADAATQDTTTDIETVTQTVSASTAMGGTTESTDRVIINATASPSSSTAPPTNVTTLGTLSNAASTPTTSGTDSTVERVTSTSTSTDRTLTVRTTDIASTRLSTDRTRLTRLSSTTFVTASREITTQMEDDAPCTECNTPSQILLYGGISMATLLLVIIGICLVIIILRRRKAKKILQKKNSRWVAFPATITAEEFTLSRTKIKPLTPRPVLTDDA